jgi:hypothetical protein
LTNSKEWQDYDHNDIEHAEDELEYYYGLLSREVFDKEASERTRELLVRNQETYLSKMKEEYEKRYSTPYKRRSAESRSNI